MYFKSLELFGFKSFAGKTKIDFEPGVTAIVGPNGVGKSNILDAIKWVLGEQSAKDLRGSNMEDVIFNGTDAKDPVGFAEVSLIMSNESKFLPIEYEEVVITRRLFRSGDSEYLLNRNQVRLKDILELFMGTGVGASAYSVIEQGRIDMIISSRPEDRRYIFEEASGIIKYKSKKKEAARKLEYTENNILRAADIIEEVKRQINSIERQAKKAERYKKEFERLTALDTRLAFLEFRRLNGEKEGLSRGISELKTKETGLLVEVAGLSSRLGELKIRETEIDAKLSEAQYKELTLNSSIERSNDKINLDNERYEELDAARRSLLKEQASAEKMILELEEKKFTLKKEYEAISQDKTQKEDLLNQRRTQLKKLEEGYRQNEELIRTGKLKIVDVLSLHSRARNELARFSSDLSNLQARERRLKAEEQEVKKELSVIQGQFTSVGREVSELEMRIEEAKNVQRWLESELNNKEALLIEAEKDIEAFKSRQLSLESRLAVLKDMVMRYEGFGAGTKALLIERRENRLGIAGVYGAVAELINVKKGYEVAVEAYLGEFLECIVVENKKVALELIGHLRRNNLGKATIVSLDSIEQANDEGDNSMPGDSVLSRLADFVETDAKFNGLISILFKGVYLVKSLEDTLALKSDALAGAEFVTLEGDISRGGFFRGGAGQDDLSAGVLNRKVEIEGLDGELVKVKAQLSSLGVHKGSLTKEGNELLVRLSSQAELLKQDELLLMNKKGQRENVEISIKKINDELSLLTLELEEVVEDITSLRERQAASEADSRRLDEEYNAIQNTLSLAQSFLENAIKEKEGLLVELAKTETELANISGHEHNLLSNLGMQEEFLNNQKVLLSEKQENLDEAALRQEELRNEINNLQAAIKEACEEKQRVSLEFRDIRNSKSELGKLVRQAEPEFNEKGKVLNSMKEELHNLEMKMQEASFRIEALKTRIGQAYKIELENLVVEIEEGFDPEAAGREVEELREKIEKMGPVNLVAIEEHEEFRERFDFLTKQKEDLINAKEALLEAIRKISKTTRELFMDTFQKVRVEFKEYFRYLFGGGQAELVLMDEQDVLECGIEIMARPPGKKLQSISLLSGGEKALCAIALLFSIFKVRPSPFCILDEVDAPLDESNIGRFTKLLSEFTKTSQFIVITHNKRTISMADVMYGITMEQSGISKVVSVKFTPLENKVL